MMMMMSLSHGASNTALKKALVSGIRHQVRPKEKRTGQFCASVTVIGPAGF